MIGLLSLSFALLVAPFESKGRVEAKNAARRHQLIVLRRNVWARSGTNCVFWLAFILARPLGATVGNFLDKSINQSGLHVRRPLASAVIAFLSSSVSAVAAEGWHASGQEKDCVANNLDPLFVILMPADLRLGGY